MEALRASQKGRRLHIRWSAKGSHQSQSDVENANLLLEGMVRTQRLVCLDKWGEELNAKHVMTAWLVRHAPWLLTR